jgi:hypothetical protein
MPMGKLHNRCRGCKWPITWSDQKRQYRRLLDRGLSPADAREAMPRCQKCVTRFLRENDDDSQTATA